MTKAEEKNDVDHQQSKEVKSKVVAVVAEDAPMKRSSAENDHGKTEEESEHALKRGRTNEESSDKASVAAEQKEEETKKVAPRVTPYSILSMEYCKVQTLTVSDQHATLLLTHTENVATAIENDTKDGDKEAEEESFSVPKEVNSLLKLTVIPFHKALLGSNPIQSSDDNIKPDLKLLQNDPSASKAIVSFLHRYNWNLKSESGAEYSYYSANPTVGVIANESNGKDDIQKLDVDTAMTAKGENDATNQLNPAQLLASALKSFGSFDVELISPASEKQLYRAMPSLGSTFVHETPQLYNTVVQPYIQSIIEGNSLNWIQNIIHGKKEKERLLVEHDLFVVNIDTKWRSHPDPNTVPREQWLNHESTSDLYCLGIVKQDGIATLRDLTVTHIPLLKTLQEEGFSAIEKIYGVTRDQVRCFVHYQPQFYHFHVHFTRLENEIGSTIERGHLVSDIIQNLEIGDGSFYEKRTITYKLKKASPLHNLIENQSSLR
eukprot:CAMPEP_0194111604 /NCGR_PEP_ID=MMETSP0150-20130528/10576_1 /TAXON_ID=122233 /ORGANISM="Chaetoceros debilis, Strain MM31A-1" /LENGTH=490 /DNA_ID=CAMNT_0038801087 /DNA_START=140 /DNA_END=1612 /DNA_ORIENTATION=-